VVIDVKLGRDDHSSILATVIGRRLKQLDIRTFLNQIKLVVKAEKEIYNITFYLSFTPNLPI
jgi:hypothetical protein